jgi:hypothetical protein
MPGTSRKGNERMKVGIVGGARVGVACLSSVVARGFASEVVLVNRESEAIEGCRHRSPVRRDPRLLTSCCEMATTTIWRARRWC